MSTEDLSFGFEDKGNFNKAKEVVDASGIKHTHSSNFGIHYIHFDSKKDMNAALKLVRPVIDKSKEHEWGKVMENREALKSMLNNLINDKVEEATLDFHNYLTTQVKLVTEMAAGRDFSSGWMKSREARELVNAFKAGHETYEFKNGRTFKAVKAVPAQKLEAGMIVLGNYNSTNQGANIYEIKGFTGDEKKYGEGGVKFKTTAELLKHYEVSSLKALYAKQDEQDHGMHSYLYCKDLEDNDEGPWFYLNQSGRWCYGSGAEPLSFTLVEEVK